jgi:hypothetical protein
MPTSSNAVFSIWEGHHCGIALKQGDGPPMFADGRLQDPDAVAVKVFRAATWNEACQVQYDHYGWGRYEPHDGWPEIGEAD